MRRCHRERGLYSGRDVLREMVQNPEARRIRASLVTLWPLATLRPLATRTLVPSKSRAGTDSRIYHLRLFRCVRPFTT